jgi:acetyl esterase/lipase
MDIAQTYDPELVVALQAFPTEEMINWNDLPAARAFLEQMFGMTSASIPDSPHVTKKDLSVPGPKDATDLTNLPPTYIAVGSHEVFLDEDVEYAMRLARAGIPVELHVYPRAFHGWDALMPTAAISKRAASDRNQALKRALYPESTLVPA